MWDRRPRLSSAGAATFLHGLLRQREHIQHSALGGVISKIRHRIAESERAGSVLGVESARHHRPRPSADTRKHGDVLLPVRPLIRDRLAYDSRSDLEAP